MPSTAKKKPTKKARKTARPKKPKMPSEHAQQAAFIFWCRESASKQADPVIRSVLRWIHAIPNGFLGSVRMRMKAVREGVCSGIADVFVPYPKYNAYSKFGRGKKASIVWNGCYLEFKVPGNKMSPTQIAFAEHCSNASYKHHIVYSWQEAARIIVEYLELPNGSYTPPGESEYELYKRLSLKK